MGIQHSTPVPTMDDLEYFPGVNKERYNGRYRASPLVALSPSLAAPGQLPGEIYCLTIGKRKRRLRNSIIPSCPALTCQSKWSTASTTSTSSTTSTTSSGSTLPSRPTRKSLLTAEVKSMTSLLRSSSTPEDTSYYRPIAAATSTTTQQHSRGTRHSYPPISSTTSSSEAFANGLQLSGPAKAMRQTMVLHEANGTVRAVIMRKEVLMHKVYQVLSPKPLYENQRPEPGCVYESTQLYLWAAVAQQCPHSLQFEMDLVPTPRSELDRTLEFMRYTTDYCGPVLSRAGQFSISDSSRRDGRTCAYFRQSPRNEWDIFVGPGVCPLLMLCYAAIIQLH
jgi:hypothetical protein